MILQNLGLVASLRVYQSLPTSPKLCLCQPFSALLSLSQHLLVFLSLPVSASLSQLLSASLSPSQPLSESPSAASEASRVRHYVERMLFRI